MVRGDFKQVQGTKKAEPRGRPRLEFLVQTTGDITTSQQFSTPYFSTALPLVAISCAHTISSGAINLLPVSSPPRLFLLTLDTEGAAAEDSLDSIAGGGSGDRVVLRITDASRNVKITKSGNIKLPTEFPTVLLDNTEDRQELEFDGTNWIAVSPPSFNS